MVTWVIDQNTGTHIGPLDEAEKNIVASLYASQEDYRTTTVLVAGLGLPSCSFKEFMDQLPRWARDADFMEWLKERFLEWDQLNDELVEVYHEAWHAGYEKAEQQAAEDAAGASL